MATVIVRYQVMETDNTSLRWNSFVKSDPGNCCSVAQLRPTHCDHVDCALPGFPVHHQLPEFTQTHVHWVGDAIQPSHPLSSPSSPALNLSQHQSQLFAWGGQSTGASALASFLPQESSPTPQFKSINSSALSLLHSATLTSIHDHRKNHSLD